MNKNSIKTSSRENKKEFFCIFTIFILLFFVYAYTAAPSIYDGDSGELTAAVHSLGLAHPTGFPLYIITGKIFSLLVPIRDVAYKLNIFSSILTAAAAVFLFLVLRNFLISRTAALSSSLIFGFGNTVWSNSGAARVYALSLFMATVLFFIFSKWTETKEKKYVYYYCGIFSLSLGSHSLILLMLVPLLIMTRSFKIFDKKMLSLLLLPLIQYVYLPIAYAKNGIIAFGEIGNFRGFLHYLTQQDFSYKLASRDSATVFEFFKEVGRLFTSEFTIFLFMLTILGFLVLGKKRKCFFVSLLAIVFVNIVLMLFYGNIGDLRVLFRYFFITYLTFAIAMGFALEFLLYRTRTKSILRYLFFVVVLLIPLFLFLINFRTNNRHKNFIIQDYAENISKTVMPYSIIISEGDTITGPLWYLQATNKLEDVIVVDRQMLGWDWYLRNMNKKYPANIQLSLLEKLGKEDRLKELILNNEGKLSIYSVFFDEQFNNRFLKGFFFIPEGVIYQIKKQQPEINSLKNQNDRIWKSYTLRNLNNYNGSFFVELLVKNYAVALNNLGTYYIEGGLLDEATEILKKAVKTHSVVAPIANANLKLIDKLQARNRQ